jgi:hypothetical protein
MRMAREERRHLSPHGKQGLGTENVTSSFVPAFYPAEEKRRDGRFHAVRVEGVPSLTVRQRRDGRVGAAR